MPTCTPPPIAQKHYVGAGTRIDSGFHGFRGSIRVRDVQLPCSTQGATFGAFSLALVACWVVKEVVDGSSSKFYFIQAQAGYGKQRLEGELAVTGFTYAEVYMREKDDPTAPVRRWIKQWAPYPPLGSILKVKGVLDVATGKWSFTVGGNTIDLPATEWDIFKGIKPKQILGQGEIWPQDTQLVGTATNKCDFTDIEYDTGGLFWTDAKLDVPFNTLPAKLAFSQPAPPDDSFKIWDLNP